jgi:hypothetical protein
MRVAAAERSRIDYERRVMLAVWPESWPEFTADRQRTAW